MSSKQEAGVNSDWGFKSGWHDIINRCSEVTTTRAKNDWIIEYVEVQKGI